MLSRLTGGGENNHNQKTTWKISLHANGLKIIFIFLKRRNKKRYWWRWRQKKVAKIFSKILRKDYFIPFVSDMVWLEMYLLFKSANICVPPFECLGSVEKIDYYMQCIPYSWGPCSLFQTHADFTKSTSTRPQKCKILRELRAVLI